MEIALKLIGGALAGLALGWLLSRVRTCSTTGCNVRANLILSLIAGTMLGLVVAWFLIRL